MTSERGAIILLGWSIGLGLWLAEWAWLTGQVTLVELALFFVIFVIPLMIGALIQIHRARRERRFTSRY